MESVLKEEKVMVGRICEADKIGCCAVAVMLAKSKLPPQ